MQPSVTLFGPLDTIFGSTGPGGVLIIEYLIIVLVVANLVTRQLAHRRHVSQYKSDGADAITRMPLHTATNVQLIIASFFYMTLSHHGGMVMSVLVLGAVITDFFEFESRKVEARRGLDLERPKGSLVASALVFLYAAYQSLFWIIAAPWDAVI